ncbi:guanine nucleotide exchange factor for Rab-3A-like [Oppia nitens]|uniref:guanine nucleotide exchange factor for Rab-3A-like n=1 Tax=Oppia nitens TaxID=1686743 RepID=UPI0023DA9E2A|nr:guanine nucleotide exchange factor for Rab-3A-like [Oppia nitens]
MIASQESPESSSTSSYSSAKTTPKCSPLNKAELKKSDDRQTSDNNDYTDNGLTSGHKKSNVANKRSSSDGAMFVINDSSLDGTKDCANNHQRSRSDCDDLIKATKQRMTEKFNQLEEESGLKLWSNSSSKETKEKTDQTLNESSELSQDLLNSLTLSEVKEQAYQRMRSELSRAQNELKLRDEEVAKLSRIRAEVESELEDLTASLFAEANDMVYKANVLRSRAQKELYEANLKIDVLQAEVQALKMLVLTSTPSNHRSVRTNGVKPIKPKTNDFAKKSPSNYELGGSAADKLDSIAQNGVNTFGQTDKDDSMLSQEVGEVDPVFHEEFLQWKKCPNFEAMNSDFMKRIYDEEIYPVFNFKDKDLTARVLRTIEDNTITIEAMADKSSFPKRCALLDAPRSCKYRMKIDDNWYNISELCRNRIIAVCDLFCYLRYIERGLVKSSFHEVYWQVIRRRRNIALSKLGFSTI